MPNETELTSPLGGDRLGERKLMHNSPTDGVYDLLRKKPRDVDRKRSDIVYDNHGLYHFVHVGKNQIVVGIRLNQPVSNGTADFAIFTSGSNGIEYVINYSRIFFDTNTEFESVQELLISLDSQIDYIVETEYDAYFQSKDTMRETVWIGDTDDDLKEWLRERVEDTIV